MGRYYSTQRPIGPGTFPRTEGKVSVTNFDERTFCESIGRDAWGYIDYHGAEPSPEQVRDYELVPEGLRRWYGVACDSAGTPIGPFPGMRIEAFVRPEVEKRNRGKVAEIRWFSNAEVNMLFGDKS